MHERQRDVSSARRQIDDHVVELSPFDLSEKLLHDLVQHGTAPDDGLVAGVEKSYGDYFEAVGLHGLDAIFSDHFWLTAYSEHQRNVWAVNVGIEQADFVAHFCESDGEVHRQRGFSYAAFAGTYRKDDIDSGEGLRSLCGLTGMRRHVCVQGIRLQRMIAIMGLTSKVDYTGGADYGRFSPWLGKRRASLDRTAEGVCPHMSIYAATASELCRAVVG